MDGACSNTVALVGISLTPLTFFSSHVLLLDSDSSPVSACCSGSCFARCARLAGLPISSRLAESIGCLGSLIAWDICVLSSSGEFSVSLCFLFWFVILAIDEKERCEWERSGILDTRFFWLSFVPVFMNTRRFISLASFSWGCVIFCSGVVDTCDIRMLCGIRCTGCSLGIVRSFWRA